MEHARAYLWDSHENRYSFDGTVHGMRVVAAIPSRIFFHRVRTPPTYRYGVVDSTTPLYIGRRNPADDRDFSVDGRLDEVGIWNRRLTDTEIKYLYNTGAGNPIQTVAE